MKWVEIKVRFEPKNDIMVEEVIANVFEEAGTGGVAVERPDLEPVEGWDPGPVSRPDYFCVKGYILADKKANETCAAIHKEIEKLKEQGLDLELSYAFIKDKDWSEAWKEYFKPERIGKRIVVKPTWCEYQAEPHDIVLEIDPGMAFGTGTHATTRLCVQLIEKYLKKGDSFLDIGTGSGILMMAAERMGAVWMTGTDFDSTAVETAGKNLALNGISSEKYTLLTYHLSQNIKKTFKVVAANILAEVIMELLDDLETVMEPDGLFICSGILEEKAPMVVAKMIKKGFTILESRIQDSWAAITGKFHG